MGRRAASLLVLLPVVLLATLAASPHDLNEQGKAAYQRGDFAGAERLFSQALAHAPRDPLLHYHRAVALTRLGRFEDAAAAHRAALRLAPPPDVAERARRSLADLGRALAPPPPRPAEPAEVAIPLVRGGGGWLVDVTLNDRPAGRFLVDTGASLSLVSPGAAGRLGLEIDPAVPPVMLQTISGLTSGPRVVIPSVRVGGVEARNVEAVVHEPGSGMDGILGNSFLARYAVTLDPDAGFLHLRRR